MPPRHCHERRAQAVKSGLIAEGVPAADVIAKGIGEAGPIASKETEEAAPATAESFRLCADPIAFRGIGMSDLLTQMFLYVLGAFLLGLLFGWLLWGRSLTRLGEQSAEDSRLSAESDHLKGELNSYRRDRGKSERLLRVLEAQLAELRAQSRPTATVTQAPVQLVSTPSRGTAPAKPAKPDNLRKIIGIGPVNERLLYEAGVTTFGQIAAWTAADIERIERTLEFGGRIEREHWVEQARLLAAGEEKEFLRRFPTAGTDKNT